MIVVEPEPKKPEKKPKKKINLDVEVKETSKVWQKKYDFVAVSDKINCVKGSKCFGWDVRGYYKVMTKKKSRKSAIQLYMELKAPKWENLNKKSLFVAGWAFPYGRWTGKEKTEVVLLQKNWVMSKLKFDWFLESLWTSKTFEKMRTSMVQTYYGA